MKGQEETNDNVTIPTETTAIHRPPGIAGQNQATNANQTSPSEMAENHRASGDEAHNQAPRSAGHDDHLDPADKHADRWVCVPDQGKVSTDSTNATKHEIAGLHRDTTDTNQGTVHQRKDKQTLGICTSDGRRENRHEKGKWEAEKTVRVMGKGALSSEKPRDQEARDTLGPISAIHTPDKLIDQNTNSPSSSKVGQNNSYRLFYRKCRCRKQYATFPKDAMGQQVTPTPPNMQGSEHRPQRVREQKDHYLSSQQSALEEALLVNNKMQEAEKLWEMTKELGVTGGNVQRNKLQQIIIDMEDRDIKEAARLGSKKRTP